MEANNGSKNTEQSVDLESSLKRDVPRRPGAMSPVLSSPLLYSILNLIRCWQGYEEGRTQVQLARGQRIGDCVLQERTHWTGSRAVSTSKESQTCLLLIGMRVIGLQWRGIHVGRDVSSSSSLNFAGRIPASTRYYGIQARWSCSAQRKTVVCRPLDLVPYCTEHIIAGLYESQWIPRS